MSYHKAANRLRGGEGNGGEQVNGGRSHLVGKDE